MGHALPGATLRAYRPSPAPARPGRLDDGLNPELELGRYLTEVCHASHIAPVAGAMEYKRPQNAPMTLAILLGFVPAQSDAWEYTRNAVRLYRADVQARHIEVSDLADLQKPLLAQLDEPASVKLDDAIDPYRESARLLGQRTGELHLALAQPSEEPDFAPEAFTDFYRQGLYQSRLSQTAQTIQLLHRRFTVLPDTVQPEAQQLMDRSREVRQRFQLLRDRRIAAWRTRVHGDYHLGQGLYTGRDFVIIDFEGEPARPLSVRRMKHSPLRDVAGMLRSLHYAAYTALLDQTAGAHLDNASVLEPWARLWYARVSTAFLQAYLTVATQGTFLPRATADLQILLDTYLLDKALYELRYELNSRPGWVQVPLHGIIQLLEAV